MKTILTLILLIPVILLAQGKSDREEQINYNDLERMIHDPSIHPHVKVEKKDVGRVQMERLPSIEMTYSSLMEYADFSTVSYCSGSKVCSLRCSGAKVMYVVTGIPDGCHCFAEPGSLEIFCSGGCPSDSLSCQAQY